METIPRDLGEGHGHPQLTGVSCPDCAGVLDVRVEGRKGHLTFVCRIGHTYSVLDLLAAKEETLEDRLWKAVLALQELGDLLHELSGRAEREGLDDVAEKMRERSARLVQDANQVRGLIEGNKPVEVDPRAARIGAPQGAR